LVTGTTVCQYSPFEAQWLLYVPPEVTLKNSTLF